MLKNIKIIDLFTIRALICLRWSCADQKSEKTIVPVKKTPKTLNCYFRSQNNFGGVKQYKSTNKKKYFGSEKDNLGFTSFFDTALLSFFRIAKKI